MPGIARTIRSDPGRRSRARPPRCVPWSRRTRRPRTPSTARRRDDSGFQVVYDGPARFEPIAGTDMKYAVNTDAEVVQADGRYYACDQGVWYSANDPNGPWRVTDARPLAVDDIPPSCPVYDIR